MPKKKKTKKKTGKIISDRLDAYGHILKEDKLDKNSISEEKEIEVSYEDIFNAEDWINLNTLFKDKNDPEFSIKLMFYDFEPFEGTFENTYKYTFRDINGKEYSLLCAGKAFYTVIKDHVLVSDKLIIYKDNNKWRLRPA